MTCVFACIVKGLVPQLKVTTPPKLSATANLLSSQLPGEPPPTTPAAQAVGDESTLNAMIMINSRPRRPNSFIGSFLERVTPAHCTLWALDSGKQGEKVQSRYK